MISIRNWSSICLAQCALHTALCCAHRGNALSDLTYCGLQIAAQTAVLIAKIARLDCPRQWPELLPTLIDAVTTSDDELLQQRILLTFYRVIKCLSSRRLAHDRKIFEEVCQKSTGWRIGTV